MNQTITNLSLIKYKFYKTNFTSTGYIKQDKFSERFFSKKDIIKILHPCLFYKRKTVKYIWYAKGDNITPSRNIMVNITLSDISIDIF